MIAMKRILLVAAAFACGIPCAWAQKTSQLPAASSLGDTNILDITQGSPGSYTSNGATLLQLKTYVLTGALTPSSSLNGANITNGTIPAAALTFSLATVATTGNYSDLLNKPSFATVATSGSYSDLTNKPTIPAAQVNSDWKASSGVAQVLNKPVTGTTALTVGQDFVTVAGLNLGFTPSYVFVVIRKSDPNGLNLWATLRGSTLTSSGFTVDLSAAPISDGYTYNLDYFIVP
jgi:hypothetical protein